MYLYADKDFTLAVTVHCEKLLYKIQIKVRMKVNLLKFATAQSPVHASVHVNPILQPTAAVPQARSPSPRDVL